MQEQLSIYRKSLALRDMSEAIAHYFEYRKDALVLSRYPGLRDDVVHCLVADASLITKEVEMAARSSSYSKRMKSLTFINVMTRNILSYCNGLEKDGVKEKEYLNLLRTELKSFRRACKKWRRSLQNGLD